MNTKQCILLIVVKCVLVTEAQDITNSTAIGVLGANVDGANVVEDGANVFIQTGNETVEELFAASQIVPDVIPVAPTSVAIVTFSKAKVWLGNNLTPTQTRYMPKVEWIAEPRKYYTLIAVDPDLPSRQIAVFRSALHWCVVNILENDVTSGTTIAEYISAGPPKDTGVHRFVFLVYQQPKHIIFNETVLYDNSTDGRYGFLVADFAIKYNLSDPVAGNFFQTSFDTYVPILYQLIGYQKASAIAIAPESLMISALVITIFCHLVY